MKHIKDENGKILSDNMDICEGLREYFVKLMNVENPKVERLVPPGEMEAINHVTGKEVWKRTGKYEARKGCWPDNIPAEVWKCLGKFGIKTLVKWFNKIVAGGVVPIKWRRVF